MPSRSDEAQENDRCIKRMTVNLCIDVIQMKYLTDVGYSFYASDEVLYASWC